VPRVPSEALRHTVTVERYRGAGAKGPTFDDPVDLKCNVQYTMRFMRDQYSREIVIDARLIFRPEVGPFPIESRFTLPDGRIYRAVRSYPYPDDRRPSHYEVLVSIWA
jgi:hypothetical protein